METADKMHYLPHMAVTKEQVETAKLRIVSDASRKHKKFATSLNDCLPLVFDVAAIP